MGTKLPQIAPFGTQNFSLYTTSHAKFDAFEQNLAASGYQTTPKTHFGTHLEPFFTHSAHPSAPT